MESRAQRFAFAAEIGIYKIRLWLREIEKEIRKFTGYTYSLEIVLACISQLLSFSEGCFGFRSSTESLESNAFAIPRVFILWIDL